MDFDSNENDIILFFVSLGLLIYCIHTCDFEKPLSLSIKAEWTFSALTTAQVSYLSYQLLCCMLPYKAFMRS